MCLNSSTSTVHIRNRFALDKGAKRNMEEEAEDDEMFLTTCTNEIVTVGFLYKNHRHTVRYKNE